jgi:cobalamin synthase
VSATEESPARVGLPRPSDLLAALGLLTCLPVNAPEPRAAAFGRAAPFLPLAGAIVGALLAGADRLIAPLLPPSASALLLVLIWELLGRGALRKKDSDSYGVTAAVAVARVVMLVLLPIPRLLPLLFAPLLGAWSATVLAVGSRDAATPARKFAPGVLFNEFAVASLITFAVAFELAEGLGILLVVAAAAAVVALRFYLHESRGGLSARWLVRCADGIELLTLALLIPFQA